MVTAPVCPRPLLRRDAEALVGLLAIVEGEATLSELAQRLVDRLSQRFAAVGLLTEGASEREFRQALHDLNQRLRYALGEYDEPPIPVP